MEIQFGFFVPLFKQLVALLSAFCIAPTPNVAEFATASLGPPGSPTVQVAQYAGADPATSLRQEPLIARVVQTQIDGLLSDRGIGMALARTADGVTKSILDTPTALARALDFGGVEALPAALALHGIEGVRTLENNTISLISALEALAIANLQLLPGAIDPREAAALVAREDEFGAIGRALLAAPTFLLQSLQRGPEGLPIALNGLGQGFVRAAATDARAIVRAVSSAAQTALALVPGASVRNLADVTVTVREPATPGPTEYIVRLPIAVGVAGSELAKGGMNATVVMVTAVVTAVTDIANAAFRPRQSEEVEQAAQIVREERPLTLPEAIAKAPVTLRNGAVAAGVELRTGANRARVGFDETLRGRTNEEYLSRAGDLDNAAVLAGGTVINGSDDNAMQAKVDAVKPNRPGPVLGAIKTMTGTLKAVRDGLRTALGLPPRKRNVPQAEKQDAKEAVPAS